MPHSSASSIPSAWKNSSTSTGVGAAPTLTASSLVEPEHRAQPREHLLVGLGDLRPRAPRGTGSPRCLSRTRSIAALSASSSRLALLLGLGGEHRLEPGLELLPDPRHGEEPRRPHLRQVGEDLARVRAARDRAGVDHRDVVVGHPLGDVRGRQPRDHPPPGLERDDLLDRLGGDHDVVVRELHALRRPGRARGVDQRRPRRRGRPRRRRGRVEVRVRALDVGERERAVGGASPSTTITCSRSGQRPCAPRASPAGTPARRSPPSAPASVIRYWISSGG